jgi:hypothetical protein
MRTHTKNQIRRAFAGLLTGTGLLLLVGCTGVAYTTPGGSVAFYDYDYYPDGDVYFYPHDHIYYWNDGGHWRSGGRLPDRYHLREEGREHLRLHSRQPWTEHPSEHH